MIISLNLLRNHISLFCIFILQVVVAVVVFFFYVHGKHLSSCRDGQLT